MKHISARFVCLFLSCLILCLAVLTACQDEKNNPGITTETESATTEAEVDEWGRDYVSSNLPPRMDFEQEEINFLIRNTDDARREFIADIDTGDRVEQAVYKRNMAVSERLNVEMNYIPVDVELYYDTMHTNEFSGDNDYQIYALYAYYAPGYTTEHYFYNLYDVPNLNLDSVWWNKDAVKEMTIKDKLFLTAGDISLTSTMNVYAMFFNKVLLEDWLPDTDVYQLVDDAQWTYETFSTLVKTVWSDENHNQSVDFGDIVGFGANGKDINDVYLPAMGVRLTTQNEEGLPEITFKNEKTMDVIDMLLALIYDNPGSLSTGDYHEYQNQFASGNILFYIDVFSFAEKLGDMKDDYGVLPIFKYDEAQSNYYTISHDMSSLFAISANCNENIQAVGAAFEAMSEESYRSVTPEYFEIVLKIRYSRDDKDAEMYDLILAGRSYNFGMVYSNCLNNVLWMWRDLLFRKNRQFLSTYDSLNTTFIAYMDKLIDAYEQY